VRLRRRASEPEPPSPEAQALLIPPDAGILSVVIRQTERWDSDELDDAIVFSTELSDRLRTDEYFTALREWFLAHGDPPREVEASRREHDAGASALAAELVITLLGAAAGVAVDALWHLVKTRLLPTSSPLRDHATYLRQLSNDDLAANLAAAAASPLNRRPSDLELVELRRDDVEIAATFRTPDGIGYFVRASDDVYRIKRVDQQ
jgi:hypothetical protein